MTDYLFIANLELSPLPLMGKRTWAIRFTGDKDIFFAMVGSLKLRRPYTRWNPQLFNGRGGWLVTEDVLLQYEDRFTDLKLKMDAVNHQERRVELSARLKFSLRLLDVNEDATHDEIKTAYRMLSKLCHPDTGGSHEEFITLQRAYEHVLAWKDYNEARRGRTAC